MTSNYRVIELDNQKPQCNNLKCCWTVEDHWLVAIEKWVSSHKGASGDLLVLQQSFKREERLVERSTELTIDLSSVGNLNFDKVIGLLTVLK